MMGDEGYMDAAAVPVPGVFTPTTSTVRDAYVYANGTSSGNPDLDPDSGVMEFQRWLARHDAGVLRSAAADAESDADADDHNPTTMRVYRAWSQWLKDRADRVERGRQAAAVPDTGDDTLRERLADVLQEHAQLYGSECSCDGVLRPDDIQALHQVDALLPLIREHTERVERAERERHKLTTDTLRSYAEARSKSTSEAVRLTAEGVLQILDREPDRD